MWEKPKTIKMYLHPPEARELITIWPDFKIVSSEVDPIQGTGFFNATGMRFLFGKSAVSPDWKKSEFIVRSDGIPVHCLKTTFDEIEYFIECFTTWDENPEVFVRLTITNFSGVKKRSTIGLMARTGEDRHLYGITGDFYANYHPLLEHWDMVKNDFSFQNNCLVDERKKILFSFDESTKANWVSINPENNFAKNYLEISRDIEPFNIVSYYFVMSDTSKNSVPSASRHSFERKNTVSRWQEELDKIVFLPDIKNNDWAKPILASLICQCFQMFVKDEGDIARPRQGGRWAGVWPTEAIEFLIAFDMLGLYNWSEKGYRFLLKHQEKQGSEKGRFNSYLSAQWENITGAVLFGLSEHIIATGNKDCFNFWRQSMLDGYNWIKNRRMKSENGLFPAGRPHDWGLTVQAWGITDAVNLMGLSKMADMFLYFKDDFAQNIKRQVDDYKECFTRILNEIVKSQEGREEIFIPNYLGIPESYPPPGPYFADGPSMLIRAGIIGPESDVFEKVERYFKNRGWMKNGLTGLMTDGLLGSYASDPWAGHTWYVSFSDFCWFLGWIRRGERDKALETMWAQIRYGMSNEYYMLERFADNDPCFCPWQPNASANGRLIQMFFEFFGKVKLRKGQYLV